MRTQLKPLGVGKSEGRRKATVEAGRGVLITLGDQDIDFSPAFETLGSD